MKFLFSFLLVILGSSLSFGQGVYFKDLSLKEAQELARRDDGKIFLFVYWDRSYVRRGAMYDVLGNMAVGDEYNEKFINIKMSTNNPEFQKIKYTYGLSKLPAMLYLNHQGEVLYKAIGARSEKALLHFAELASDDATNLNALQKKFLSGNRSQELTLTLAEAYLESGDGRHEKMIEEYLKKEDDWNTEENVRLLFKHGRPTMESELFRYMVKHESVFREIIGDYHYEEKVDFAIKYDSFKQGVHRCKLPEIVAFSKKYYDDTSLAFTKAARYNIVELLKSQDAKDHRKSIEVINKYLSTNNYDNFVLYNAAAWEIQLLTDDEKILAKCLEWVNRSIE